MCWSFKKQEQPEPVEKPDWVTQSREKVADEEEIAASTHYSILVYYKEHPEEQDRMVNEGYGDEEYNWHWFRKHSEAAWYIRNPEAK